MQSVVQDHYDCFLEIWSDLVGYVSLSDSQHSPQSLRGCYGTSATPLVARGGGEFSSASFLVSAVLSGLLCALVVGGVVFLSNSGAASQFIFMCLMRSCLGPESGFVKKSAF